MGPCGASALVIQASVAWGGWGLERGWGEVVEGEGGDFWIVHVIEIWRIKSLKAV